MSSVDGKWDRDVAGDPLPPWGARSGSGDGEFNHDGATDDSKVDHTESGGGERTTGVGGFNIIIVGDRETNANLGDNVRGHDGACDDGEVDRTRSGGGERTTSAGGVNVIVVGDWETNGSLGVGVREHDGYQQSRRV
jgi:hypothetical protein